MKYLVTIGDRAGFMNYVFGADSIIANWPELCLARDAGGGLNIRKYPNGMYYILDEGDDPVMAWGFFSKEELRDLEVDSDVRFMSNAVWPECDGVTTEGPYSMSMACDICDMFTDQGWRGDGKIKPLTTWVEPIDD